MPRVKKEVPEAETVVKKTNKKVDSTKSKPTKKKNVKEKKEKVEVVEIKEESKIKDADIKKKYTQKAFFFPRLIAYIIDILIISLVVSGILMVVPKSDNYEKYLEEYEQVQTDFLEEKITADEYMNRSIEVVHDLDYSNVLSMILEVVAILLYFVVFQCYNKGQTIGKKLMHIRIVSNDGEDLNINHYIIRSIIINSLLLDILIIGMVLFMNKQIYYYSSFGLQGIQTVLLIVSAFMMMYRKDGRGIQDYVAHTKVIMCDEE